MVVRVGLEPKSFLLLTPMACCYHHLLFIHSFIHSSVFQILLEHHREWEKHRFQSPDTPGSEPASPLPGQGAPKANCFAPYYSKKDYDTLPL